MYVCKQRKSYLITATPLLLTFKIVFFLSAESISYFLRLSTPIHKFQSMHCLQLCNCPFPFHFNIFCPGIKFITKSFKVLSKLAQSHNNPLSVFLQTLTKNQHIRFSEIFFLPKQHFVFSAPPEQVGMKIDQLSHSMDWNLHCMLISGSEYQAISSIWINYPTTINFCCLSLLE